MIRSYLAITTAIGLALGQVDGMSSASGGGGVTTGTQTFSGDKTFSGQTKISTASSPALEFTGNPAIAIQATASPGDVAMCFSSICSNGQIKFFANGSSLMQSSNTLTLSSGGVANVVITGTQTDVRSAIFNSVAVNGGAVALCDASGVRVGGASCTTSVDLTVSSASVLDVGGGIRLATATAKPTCASAYRGTFWVVQSGAGVKDTVEVCAKDAADAYAWRTIY